VWYIEVVMVMLEILRDEKESFVQEEGSRNPEERVCRRSARTGM
jgi:hypothetical protein